MLKSPTSWILNFQGFFFGKTLTFEPKFPGKDVENPTSYNKRASADWPGEGRGAIQKSVWWAPMWAYLLCARIRVETLYLGTKLGTGMGPCAHTFGVRSLAFYPEFCNSEHVLGLLNVNISSDWVPVVWSHPFLQGPGHDEACIFYRRNWNKVLFTIHLLYHQFAFSAALAFHHYRMRLSYSENPTTVEVTGVQKGYVQSLSTVTKGNKWVKDCCCCEY